MEDDFGMGEEGCQWISMQTVAPLYPWAQFSGGHGGRVPPLSQTRGT